jgi:hypothetical protein
LLRLSEVCEPEIPWTAPVAVRALVESLGRTEDIRFSPTNRRLALTGFLAHRIVVCDVEIGADGAIALPAAVAIASPAVNLPHGADFVDDDTIAVASRGHGIALLRIPPASADARTVVVDSLQSLGIADTDLLRVPGSIQVVDLGDAIELLVCNNASGEITRHRVTADTARRFEGGEAIAGKWLELPDGLTVSRDRHWLAVSDHGSHLVQLYQYGSPAMRDRDPDGILRGVYYPHGLRFSADSRHLFVADAGTPFVWAFGQSTDRWNGVGHPLARVRVMDHALFAKGDVGPGEGGPKGIDIDATERVLAIASVHRPLAFFDFQSISSQVQAAEGVRGLLAETSDIRYELHALQTRRDAAIYVRDKAELLTYMVNSASWRVTEPLRRMHSWFRRSK